VAKISQRYWLVRGVDKLDALTRILDAEESFDAALVFVRTKIATEELADKLAARGYAAAALNGDMNQGLRERVIEQLKNGTLDIVIATDVAARGIDVPRISHVINYDIPYDTEAYVHRIGRTGRAGREGVAILFVAPRETRMLKMIERATRAEHAGRNRRVAQFRSRWGYGREAGLRYAHRDRPQPGRAAQGCGTGRERRGASADFCRRHVGQHQPSPTKRASPARVHIGQINLFDDYSSVELPAGLPADLMDILRRIRVRQFALKTRVMEPGEFVDTRPPRRAPPAGKKPDWKKPAGAKPAWQKRER
jgi:superfamily II DNA/RNA helicase